MALRGSVTKIVRVDATPVFTMVTDLRRLAEWNTVITSVQETPSGPGAAASVEALAGILNDAPVVEG